MTIFTVVGARPQFIKAAVMSRVFSKSDNITEIIVHTGQHFDHNMSAVFFEELSIPKPNYNLAIGGMTHGQMTGRMIEKLEELMLQEKPDAVLVYGDTNSTLAAALAASKIHIPVIHIEAGLRSFNMDMPEEINRILTDRLSSLLFCPTELAVSNLKNEGYAVEDKKICNVGDIMYDASLFYAKKRNELASVKSSEYILCTIHRAENTDNPNTLAEIVGALNEISQEIEVVLPLHPRTKAKLTEFGLNLDATIIEPASYMDMIGLIRGSKLIITDSGGLQKEAYFFKKKCVTIREQTEWVELIDVGANVLSPAQKGKIASDVKNMLAKKVDFSIKLYGEGNTGDLILENILQFERDEQ
jgi:UDP-GlcNAc3NAcA epimerase